VVYHAAWMRFLKERNLSSFDELLAYSKLHPDEKALVPDVYGHVIETQSQNDPLNADQNACRNIAHRGIKYLYGLCEKKSPKKGKKKKSAPKIRIRKGLRRKPAN
jgi:hypothetical protein